VITAVFLVIRTFSRYNLSHADIHLSILTIHELSIAILTYRPEDTCFNEEINGRVEKCKIITSAIAFVQSSIR
jgi:hypothetical protein